LGRQDGRLLKPAAEALAALAIAFPLLERKKRDGQSLRVSPGRIVLSEEAWSLLVPMVDGANA
jgi:hypothetical protein